jgi:formate/nitrite transporter FocA (FNT family)
MGFSLVAQALLTIALPDRPWRPLIAKPGYSVGFLIVVLGRQQLFSENDAHRGSASFAQEDFFQPVKGSAALGGGFGG